MILKSSVVLFLVSIFLLLSAKSTFGLTCLTTWTYQPSLVVAELISQELQCEKGKTDIFKGKTNIFKKKLQLKGSSPETFTIATPAQKGECPVGQKEGEILIDVLNCAGCPPHPNFEPGKTYILSISNNEQSGVSLPICQRIVSEAKGIIDPRIFLYALRVYFHPLIIGLFLLWIGLTSLFSQIIPSSIAAILSAVIVLGLIGIGGILGIKVIRIVIRKIRINR